MARSRYRGRYHPRRRRHPFGLAVVLLAMLLAVSGPRAALLLLELGSVLSLLFWGTVAFVVVRVGRRIAGRRAAVAPAIPWPRPADPDTEWAAARRRFDAVRGEYAGYECDPLAVLRLPALADVSVPATARFVHAFAEAQALDTDRRPPPAHLRDYLQAVDAAERAWRAAREAAERIRLAGLAPAERAGVQRVIKLLTMAAGTGHEAERQSAYAKARDELARLERAGTVTLPPPARFALDDRARGRLPA